LTKQQKKKSITSALPHRNLIFGGFSPFLFDFLFSHQIKIWRGFMDSEQKSTEKSDMRCEAGKKANYPRQQLFAIAMRGSSLHELALSSGFMSASNGEHNESHESQTP
jgi:hypothetical protein